ncbi:hypothetical protein ZWY2020_005657 [Hordeum vulgare]|nr:hypothetical protein ZWY2020_005657 [Hordeum vulgare]
MQVATSVDITDMDLASEKSLWALYDRWREHHNVVRDLGEKARRFSVFEENARMIHHSTKATHQAEPQPLRDMTGEEVGDGYGRCSTPPNSGSDAKGRSHARMPGGKPPNVRGLAHDRHLLNARL